MRTTTKTFIWLAVVAVFAVGLPLAYVWTRQAKQQAAQPSPTPAQITTSSGQGATATYQAEEKQQAAQQPGQRPTIRVDDTKQGTSLSYEVQEDAPTDSSKFRVTPLETVAGRKVMIHWNLPGAENIKVNGKDVPTVERDGRVVSSTRGMITEAAPDLGSAGGEFTYRLEATRVDLGVPVRYEAKLKLLPRRK
jgi:hypothetical protein